MKYTNRDNLINIRLNYKRWRSENRSVISNIYSAEMNSTKLYEVNKDESTVENLNENKIFNNSTWIYK